jgi:hypothetical protein
VADGIEASARCIGAHFTGLGIGVFENFPGLEIEEFLVADILHHQRFFAIANDDPISLLDFQFLHLNTSGPWQNAVEVNAGGGDSVACSRAAA